MCMLMHMGAQPAWPRLPLHQFTQLEAHLCAYGMRPELMPWLGGHADALGRAAGRGPGCSYRTCPAWRRTRVHAAHGCPWPSFVVEVLGVACHR